ncbi:MAG TPA: LuxR C-terminal-related transcriptional regulator [Thermoleophilaceae bacterium]|jgi:DNA-binding CsgD family transcriptional regulator|nr:LuxR C-terminal-related transcriptional regulator [Thermoleophilaceae bacterium]
MKTYEPTGNPPPVAASSPWMPASQERLLWAFFDRAPVALLAAGDDRQILRVNSHWSDMTGYGPELATRMRIDDLLAPESRPGIEMRWTDLLATGLGTARIVLLRPDHVRRAVRYGAFANVLPGVHVAAYLPESAQDPRAPRPARARRAGQLTVREQESLRLVAMGLTTAAAASRLGISPETVRTHVRNAMNKLGARTRAQAIAVAMRDGEIPG